MSKKYWAFCNLKKVNMIQFVNTRHILFGYIRTKFGNSGHSLPFVHSLSTFSPRSWQSESCSFCASPSNLVISLTKWVFRVKVAKSRKPIIYLRKIQNREPKIVLLFSKFFVKIQSFKAVEFILGFSSNVWVKFFKVLCTVENELD